MILSNTTEDFTNGDTNINDIFKETFQFSGLNKGKVIDESSKCCRKNHQVILEVFSSNSLNQGVKDNYIKRNSLKDFNVSAIQLDKCQDKVQCRICLEDGDLLFQGFNKRFLSSINDSQFTSNPRILINPCDCKGSLANVHYLCLIKWISEIYPVDNTEAKCELCLKHFVFYESQEMKPLSKETKIQIAKVLLSGIAMIIVVNVIVAFIIVNFSNVNLCLYILLSLNAFFITFFICYMKRYLNSLPREYVQDMILLDRQDPRYKSFS